MLFNQKIKNREGKNFFEFESKSGKDCLFDHMEEFKLSVSSPLRVQNVTVNDVLLV